MYSGVVCNIASEEMDEIFQVTSNPLGMFSVAYDPLDGSSLVDVNLAVGTIVGIYQGDTLQPGRNMVGAMYILYRAHGSPWSTRWERGSTNSPRTI